MTYLHSVIELTRMPRTPMLVVQCATGVVYGNLVGGNARWRETVEGLLSPVSLDDEPIFRICDLAFPQARGQEELRGFLCTRVHNGVGERIG